jgi:hypothetical protein
MVGGATGPVSVVVAAGTRRAGHQLLAGQGGLDAGGAGIDLTPATSPSQRHHSPACDSARPRSGVGASSSTATASRPPGSPPRRPRLPGRTPAGALRTRFACRWRAQTKLLMAPGQHLDRLGQLRVARHRPVMVAVGADQISQHPRIGPVGLGPRDGVPLPIAARRQRVHREDLVAGRDQRPDQQPPVGEVCASGRNDLGTVKGHRPCQRRLEVQRRRTLGVCRGVAGSDG